MKMEIFLLLIKGDNKTKICGLARRDCYNRITSLLFMDDIDRIEDKNAQSFRMNCDCLPACNTIQYTMFIDRTRDNMEMTKLTNPK